MVISSPCNRDELLYFRACITFSKRLANNSLVDRALDDAARIGSKSRRGDDSALPSNVLGLTLDKRQFNTEILHSSIGALQCCTKNLQQTLHTGYNITFQISKVTTKENVVSHLNKDRKSFSVSG